MSAIPWKVSLHGGHSRAYCDHADDTLEDILAAAEAAGCAIYGVAEHAPRVDEPLLYREERDAGWNVDTLLRMFDAYAARVTELANQYRGRMAVLRGFESEVVPTDRYAEVMLGLRAHYGFDYLVGSVHHVDGRIIDYRKDEFDAAALACGGLEGLAVRYYETYREMILTLGPEVAAHFDLVRRNAPDEASVSTPRARAAARAALEAVQQVGAILDINTAGYRKGLTRPYPAPWVLEEARALGIPVCFGDDAHRVSEVLACFDDARAYLLAHGYTHITALVPGPYGLTHDPRPL